MIPHTVGWSDLARFSIFENLEVSVDQVPYIQYAVFARMWQNI